MSSPAGTRPSLRGRLTRHILLPVVATWAVGTGIALLIAMHFAEQAFDRSLLDDAYDLVERVHVKDGRINLALSAQEMSTLLFDQSETMYFAVFDGQGRLVAGQPGLTPAAGARPGSPELGDTIHDGRSVRTATVRQLQPAEVTVIMGQTTVSRTRLLRQLLAYSTLPQIALFLALAWWLRRATQRDLEPLAQLHKAIDERDASDLKPLARTLTTDATTQEVERIGRAVDSLLARLDASLEAQREFAGTVAHELRTPLAAIRAHAAFGLSHAEPALWRQELHGVSRAEQRASRLVNQLLALARADEARSGLVWEVFDAAAFAREVLLRFLPAADDAQVDLGGEGLDHHVPVRADRALLEGALSNLLDNALRYGKTEHSRVTIRVVSEGEAVLLSVIDNGPGLTAQDAEQLKTRWSQGSRAKQLGAGAGLGLAIVGRYAQLLGAQLRLGPGPDGSGLCATLVFSPP